MGTTPLLPLFYPTQCHTQPITPNSNTKKATPRLAPELIPNTDIAAQRIRRSAGAGQRIGNPAVAPDSNRRLCRGDAQFADDGVQSGLRGEESSRIEE